MNNIMAFGRNSFLSWPKGLEERIEEAEREDKVGCDKTHICLDCGETFDESDLWLCHKCNQPMCPKCGGDISTIEEYEEAMKENDWDEWQEDRRLHEN